MPIKHASIKDLRKTKRRTARNERTKQNVRHLLKAAQKAVTEEKGAGAVNAARAFQKAVDKAVKVGVISKGRAARKKSEVMKASSKK